MKKVYSKTVNSEIIERYEAGESAPAIAKDFGVSNETILRALRFAGVETRRGGSKLTSPEVAARLELIKGLRESGAKYKDIGEAVGISTQRANAIVRAAE